MTATDELRRMLDERGVKYRTHGTTDRTWFEVGNISWFIIERENGSLTADAVFLTPEQAIAATVGRRTCHKVRVHKDIEDEEHCSECGRFLGFANDALAEPYNFCPKCGAEVVNE